MQLFHCNNIFMKNASMLRYKFIACLVITKTNCIYCEVRTKSLNTIMGNQASPETWTIYAEIITQQHFVNLQRVPKVEWQRYVLAVWQRERERERRGPREISFQSEQHKIKREKHGHVGDWNGFCSRRIVLEAQTGSLSQISAGNW